MLQVSSDYFLQCLHGLSHRIGKFQDYVVKGLPGIVLSVLTYFRTVTHKKAFLTLSKQAPNYTCMQYKSFENTFGKAEIAHYEPFSTEFSTLLENFLPFSLNLKFSSAYSFRRV